MRYETPSISPRRPPPWTLSPTATPPSTLIKQLSQDRALAEADTLLLTIPNQLGFEENWSIIRNFADYVAPALGWEPARPGVLPTGYDIDEVVAD